MNIENIYKAMVKRAGIAYGIGNALGKATRLLTPGSAEQNLNEGFQHGMGIDLKPDVAQQTAFKPQRVQNPNIPNGPYTPADRSYEANKAINTRIANIERQQQPWYQRLADGVVDSANTIGNAALDRLAVKPTVDMSQMPQIRSHRGLWYQAQQPADTTNNGFFGQAAKGAVNSGIQDAKAFGRDAVEAADRMMAFNQGR